MKIIIVGAVGAVGKTAVHGLSGRHEIICVGRTSGDVQMDIMDHADPELESNIWGQCKNLRLFQRNSYNQ